MLRACPGCACTKASMYFCHDTKEAWRTHIVHQRLAVASLDQKVIVDARMLKVMADCCTRHTISELHFDGNASLSTFNAAC